MTEFDLISLTPHAVGRVVARNGQGGRHDAVMQFPRAVAWHPLPSDERHLRRFSNGTCDRVFQIFGILTERAELVVNLNFSHAMGLSPPGRGNDLCNRENVLKQLLSSPLDHNLELLLHRLQVLPVQFHFLIALPGDRFQSSHPLLVFGQALWPLSVHVTQLPR